jgi:hypothetical protein
VTILSSVKSLAEYANQQRRICERFGAAFDPPARLTEVGFALKSKGKSPIDGTPGGSPSPPIARRADRTMLGARLNVLLLPLLAACAPTPMMPRTASVAPREPMHADAFAEAARAAGLSIERCPNAWSVVLKTPGARVATTEETHEFLDRHRQMDEGFFRDGVDTSGLGPCGCEREPGLCAVVELWEDAPAVATLPEAVARAAKEELPEVQILVSVTLLSAPKPRCSSPKVDCGPLPYEGVASTRPRPPGRRRAIAQDSALYYADGAKCSHDGECKIVGRCVGWRDRTRISDLLERTRLIGAWCGCVDGSCAWFR